MKDYCHTCQREFKHDRGIAIHRAWHKRRKEDCEITFSISGRRFHYAFSTDQPPYRTELPKEAP